MAAMADERTSSNGLSDCSLAVQPDGDSSASLSGSTDRPVCTALAKIRKWARSRRRMSKSTKGAGGRITSTPVLAPVTPRLHNRHAWIARWRIEHSQAAVAASAAEHAPLVPSAAASAASSSTPYAAPLAFADQASWQQCLDDPCQEYADSIYQHLRATELLHSPDPAYMESVQGDLTHAMRSILIDWMVEVADEDTLAPQTLFLAVAYLDRFLSKQVVTRDRLQLVGSACLWTAAKYWEVDPQFAHKFVYITDYTYTKLEIKDIERDILVALQFKLNTPTPWEFARRFCKAAEANEQTEKLVDYLLELMLQESASLTYRPSIVAASAVFLALYTLNHSPWSERLEVRTCIRVEELQGCVRTMHAIYGKVYCGQHTLKAAKDKYNTNQMLKVAKIPPRDL